MMWLQLSLKVATHNFLGRISVQNGHQCPQSVLSGSHTRKRFSPVVHPTIVRIAAFPECTVTFHLLDTGKEQFGRRSCQKAWGLAPRVTVVVINGTWFWRNLPLFTPRGTVLFFASLASGNTTSSCHHMNMDTLLLVEGDFLSQFWVTRNNKRAWAIPIPILP
jgi:hypothetical protein